MDLVILSNAVIVAVYVITFDGELLKPPCMDYHCQSFTTGADNDPEERFAISRRFLLFPLHLLLVRQYFSTAIFTILL